MEDTRGFRLDPPVAFADFRMTERYKGSYVGVVGGVVGCAGEEWDCLKDWSYVTRPGITPEDADRIVRNAVGTGANYIRRSDIPEAQNRLVFRALQGDVPDPEGAARRMMRSIERNEQVPFQLGPHTKWAWPAQHSRIEGAPGTAMICRHSRYSEVAGTEIASSVDATCVWADHSTVAAIKGYDMPLDDLADLAAELHRTARVRE
ncbi:MULTISPECIES: hypothetical protein [Streptomyces]|uniref:Uncharacterized protein n=1 Tax=Streptomyces changanensis TaxID=2964669 RepID=A0ABY5N8H7_9ACTN|nr:MULTISPECIES: hypothetical protein [Streptomyces]UUS32243.1 hypothetical protein NRO40_16435 [Streptomyces changanensis]